jgi:thiamine biosynthesis lipoprotein
MSTYKDDSELSRINRLAAKQALVVNRELFNLIDRSLDFSKKTSGVFDITYSGVGRLYDYRKKKKPADKEIEKTLPLINYRHVLLDRSAKTIKFARPGVRIDLGGIAKGYAVDTSIDLLKVRGITSALVTAGGDSRLIGNKQGRPWMIGIRDPRNREDMIAVLPLMDEAISTSGDYERYFEKDGVRYHHIINPVTGRSAMKARSASVIGPDATTTDALSTSIFILGPKKGLALIESLPGIEAVVIDPSGKMHFSSGLEKPSSP